MAFKPNYSRDRAERQRAARARTEEKQRRKEEKLALRKAERDAAEVPPDVGHFRVVPILLQRFSIS
jgi:hypothetical protein